MKRLMCGVQISPFFTENRDQTPEELLQIISINHSNQRIYHKTDLRKTQNLHTLKKKDSFVLNGWDQTNIRQNKTAKPAKKSKSRYMTPNKTALSSIPTQDVSPDLRRTVYKSLELKSTKCSNQTNFRFGSFDGEKLRFKCKTSRKSEQQQPRSVKQSREKLKLIDFYHNQRVKRILMSECLQVVGEVPIIQYPIMDSFFRKKSSYNKKKAQLFKRFMN